MRRPTVNRRHVVVGGLVAGAAVIADGVSASAQPGQTQSEGPVSDRGVIGTVAARGVVSRRGDEATPIQAEIDGAVVSVTPTQFPPGWQLEVGDKLVADRVSRQAAPLVDVRRSSSDGPVEFVLLNADPALNRRIADYGL